MIITTPSRETLRTAFHTSALNENIYHAYTLWFINTWPLFIGNISGKQVCDILEKHGFTQVRQRGGPIVMQKRLPDTTITVPIPNHTEIRIGALQSIIRQSGLNKSEPIGSGLLY